MNIYKTVQGDTWDLIAKRLWPKLGGEHLMNILIEKNPEYRKRVIFEAGVELIVPDVSVPVVTNLPPWKRSAR